MTNPQNPNPNNREDNLTKGKTSSYSDGYSDGRVSGTNLKNEALQARDQNNTAGGLLIGIGITALLGLSGLAYYFWGRPPAINPVIVVPAPAQQPAKQTTIIEKTNTIERVSVPAVATVRPQSAPNVNVKVAIPQPQTPKQEKTDIKVIVPSNSQPAPAAPNTTINVAPPESSTKTSTPTSNPDTSSKTQTSPNTPKTSSDTGTQTNSNP
ncbi:hypothetical protein FJR11_04700 [Anabaena sp. UHCC 0187]|nr:hypothetical protein [Anabaena sp. UHCC 0187]